MHIYTKKENKFPTYIFKILSPKNIRFYSLRQQFSRVVPRPVASGLHWKHLDMQNHRLYPKPFEEEAGEMGLAICNLTRPGGDSDVLLSLRNTALRNPQFKG